MDRAGALIRKARRARGLSQASLALRAGTKQSTVSRLEAGAERPTLERLERLLAVMGYRLGLELEPASAVDRAEVEAARALGPAERLLESMSWNLFATEVEIAAAEARERG